jgi:hypothetical protein
MVCCMRGFPSGALRRQGRPGTLSELDEPHDHKPLISMGVLSGIGLLLLIALGLAMAAQLLVSAPH